MALTKVSLINDGVIVVGHLHTNHGITTDNIGEGTNAKYYSDTLVQNFLTSNNYITTTDVANLETLTSLSLAGNTLTYTDEDGNATNINISLYTDSDVDAHLNTSTAANSQILRWTGTDYEWTDQTLAGTSTVVAPFAFIRVTSNSSTSGTSISHGTFTYTAGSDCYVDFTFANTQPNTNYHIITDYRNYGDVNYTIDITNVTTSGFRANFWDSENTYDPVSIASVLAASPTFIVYAETPTITVVGSGNLTDLSVTTNAAGSAALSYNSANGTFTYTPPDLSSYLTSFTETDPIYTTSSWFSTTNNASNWDTAYSWGNHASQSYATQTYVNTAIANLVDSAPTTLDTLNELAAALGDDPNFATTITNSIGTKWTQDNTKISNWDAAYSWGNHASAGYLTGYTETDTLATVTGRGNTTSSDLTTGRLTLGNNVSTGGFGSFADYQIILYKDSSASTSYGLGIEGSTFMFHTNGVYKFYANNSVKATISNSGDLTLTGTISASGYNNSNWDTAFGWGDHAVAGYASSSHTHDDRYLVKGGSWNAANMPGSRWGGFSANGGEVVFQQDNPNNGQMSVMVDGNFYAGENNGFWSLYSSNSYNSKAGMYADSNGYLILDSPSRVKVKNGSNSQMNINFDQIWTDSGNLHLQYSGSGNIDMNYGGGYAFSRTSLRAPIFYDSNDTGYYVDPDSRSIFNTLNLINGGSGMQSNAALNIGFTSSGETRAIDIDGGWSNNESKSISFIHGSASTNIVGQINCQHNNPGSRLRWGKLYHNGDSSTYTMELISESTTSAYLQVVGSMRSPIFYDSDNTGYYLDPASTSSVNTLNASAVDATTLYGDDVYTTGGWFRNHTNNNGIYWSTTGWHLFPTNSNDFTLRSGVSNEASIRFSNSSNTTWGYIHNDANKTIGFLNDGRSWVSYTTTAGHHYAVSSSRAPIFYDSNDTAYYVDPASTSNLSGLTVASQITGSVSGSSNSIAITGYGNGNFTFHQASGSFNVFSGWHNYLISNHGNGSNYYNTIIAMPFWGSPRYSRLEGGTQRGPYEFWTSERTIDSSYDIYAPVYYDKNDTAYYLDPNATSNLYNLQLSGAKHTYLYITPGNGYEAMVRFNGGSGSTWYVGSRTSTQLVGSTDAWHVYSQTTGQTVSGTDSAGNHYAVGSSRAPIFYDSNDTAYYVDPASTSVLNYTNGTEFKFRTSTNNGRFNAVGDWGTRFYTDAGYIQFGPANTGHAHIYTDRSNFYLNQPIQVNGVSIMNTNDIRSKIFYDWDNTSYYTDPSDVSQLSQLKIFNATYGYSAMYGSYDLSRTHNDSARHGLVINASNYPHIDVNANGSSEVNATHGPVISMTGKLGSGFRRWGMGISQYNPNELSFGYADNNSNPHYGVGLNWGSPAKMWIDTGGHLYSTGSMRSPIFYDSDNTGYFLDLSATHSALIRGNLRFNDYGAGITGNYTSTRLQTIFNMGSAYQIAIDGSSASGAYGLYWSHQNAGSLGGANNLASHGILIIENGTWKGAWGGGSLRTPGDVRGTEFYDYNNTGYYCNPANTSLLSELNVNHFGINNSNSSTRDGISLYGGYSGGEPTYGLLFTGTSLGTHGSVTGSWATYFTMNNDNSRGWIFRRVGSGNCASISAGGHAAFDGSVYAPLAGIGTAADGAASTGAKLKVLGGASGVPGLRVDSAAYSSAAQFYFGYNGSGIGVNNTAGYNSAGISFKYGSTFVGSININSSSTSYNTSSDYRLKENLVPITDGIERVKLLQPKRFNFIGEENTVDGFVAHEAQTVVPEAVTGEKDAVDWEGNPEYQGIDQGKLVPLLTAALQEAIVKIEDLEARIQTLENA